jgi:hypothetical protein
MNRPAPRPARLATLGATAIVAIVLGMVLAPAAGAATASQIDTPSQWPVLVQKEWQDPQGTPLAAPPADLPADYAITISSGEAAASCAYPSGSTALSCTYPAEGFMVDAGASYTVTEVNLPAGFVDVEGVGTFTTGTGSPGFQCRPQHGGIVTPCHHVVVNRSFRTVPGVDVTIEKTAVGGSGTFGFTIACEAPVTDEGGVSASSAVVEKLSITVADGATAGTTMSGVTPGSTCTVTETDAGGATLTSVSGGAEVRDGDGVLHGVTMPVDGPTTVGLTNTFASVADATVTPPPAAPADAGATAQVLGATVTRGTLPVTGSSDGRLVLAGLGTLLLGLTCVCVARIRRATRSI